FARKISLPRATDPALAAIGFERGDAPRSAASTTERDPIPSAITTATTTKPSLAGAIQGSEPAAVAGRARSTRASAASASSGTQRSSQPPRPSGSTHSTPSTAGTPTPVSGGGTTWAGIGSCTLSGNDTDSSRSARCTRTPMVQVPTCGDRKSGVYGKRGAGS